MSNVGIVIGVLFGAVLLVGGLVAAFIDPED
jgi:hypothetical protein